MATRRAASTRFNPRPPISQRATSGIRAWRKAERMFQSTPANFTAGDYPVKTPDQPPRTVSIHARQFHSGRLLQARQAAGQTQVSIHARQFHSGRPASTAAPARICRSFNPRPPISQRATTTGAPSSAACRRFNPRPPISQRATRLSSGRRAGTPSFNPRPPISQRATRS